MISISQKLFHAIKLNPIPAYKISMQAGIHPNTLSKILHNAIPIRKDDKRILRIGEILGLTSGELFEETTLKNKKEQNGEAA